MSIQPTKPPKGKKAARPALKDDHPAGRVFGYARVSTAMQAEEGESLDVQQRCIAGYAMQHGMTIEKTYVERGVSGSRPLDERPEGGALMRELRRDDVVITPKLDRMFRSALDALAVLAKLKDNGISLHMIDLGGDTTGNGISKLVFTILSAVAEAERDRTRERITEVKRDQKQRGRFLGGTPPFGWRKGKDGALVPVLKEQAAIARMRALRDEGASFRAISEALWDVERIRLSHVGVRRALAATAEDRAA
jgi:DNA invertase Pin-like site-specific DNA recombinase